tara:strand:+ start:17 stop:238 length:222 start_codon:yes stop_codon:yes gene_type:complete
MTVEKKYNNILNRFKREAGLPIYFTNLTEEQKTLIEIMYEDEEEKESAKVIKETVEMIRGDLDFVLHKLEDIS